MGHIIGERRYKLDVAERRAKELSDQCRARKEEREVETLRAEVERLRGVIMNLQTQVNYRDKLITGYRRRGYGNKTNSN